MRRQLVPRLVERHTVLFGKANQRRRSHCELCPLHGLIAPLECSCCHRGSPCPSRCRSSDRSRGRPARTERRVVRKQPRMRWFKRARAPRTVQVFADQDLFCLGSGCAPRRLWFARRARSGALRLPCCSGGKVPGHRKVGCVPVPTAPNDRQRRGLARHRAAHPLRHQTVLHQAAGGESLVHAGGAGRRALLRLCRWETR